MTDHRTKIIWDEMTKLIQESAASKGAVLKLEHVNDALKKFIERYDLFVVFWNPGEGREDRALVIRRSLKEDADLIGNAAYVQDRETAVQLHTLCRGPDNIAPDPPGE